jgi:hypothetical protein
VGGALLVGMGLGMGLGEKGVGREMGKSKIGNVIGWFDTLLVLSCLFCYLLFFLLFHFTITFFFSFFGCFMLLDTVFF